MTPITKLLITHYSLLALNADTPVAKAKVECLILLPEREQ